MRLYLSATEDCYRKNAARRIAIGVRHALFSYNGAGDAADRIVRAHGAMAPRENWCLDSGAHFFLSAFYKHGRLRPVAEAEAHQRALVEIIKALPVKPHFTVELDLQDLYGVRVVERWRREVWAPLEAATGVRVCYVWHPTDGAAGWDRMLADPAMGFLGLPAGAVFKALPERAAMVHAAYEAGKPVHGFALVRDKVMRAVPFYSVDSTSWGSGAIYGSLRRFDPRTGRLHSVAVGRRARRDDPAAVAANLAAQGGRLSHADMDNATHGRLSAVYQELADAYGQCEQWFTSYWRARGVDWAARLGPGWR